MKVAPPLLVVLLLSSIPTPQVWALDSSYTADGNSSFFWVGGRERNLSDARGNARSKAVAMCRKAGGQEQTQYVMQDETGVTYSGERCKHRVFMGSDEYLCRATATVQCALPPESVDCNGDGTPDVEVTDSKKLGNKLHPAARLTVKNAAGEESQVNISPDDFARMTANSYKQKQYFTKQLEKYKAAHPDCVNQKSEYHGEYQRLKDEKTDKEKLVCDAGRKRKDPTLLQKVKGKIHRMAAESLQRCLDRAASETDQQKCYGGGGTSSNPGGVRN